jgi:hypothetical protein
MGWVSILDPQTIAAVLEVPPDWKLIGYFCLGFPEAEDAGDTVFAQSRQMRVSDLFREHHDKRVAGNPQAIRHCPGDNCRPSRGTERRYGAGGEEWQLRRCN